jgi:2-dehydropantoate 2-reductase
MRILVIGAGAIGGYFGGRLLEAGRDVTFLVRAGRAAELARSGLMLKSSSGDVTLPNPPTVLAEDLRAPFDLIILSCKAYDLANAIASFAPAVGPSTAILPLLNGMRHLDDLDARFGHDRVLGGQCLIAATLDANKAIVHLSDSHDLSFGERDGTSSERIGAIAAEMTGAKFVPHPSAQIVQDMWEKWVFLATFAGATCLMRGAIGDIEQTPGGKKIVLDLFEECAGVAQANGHPPRTRFVERSHGLLTAAGSALTASMLRDIERNAPIEADHIVGDLIRRGTAAGRQNELSLLGIVQAHLCAYEARRRRTADRPAV